jgi:hypothetical protein
MKGDRGRTLRKQEGRIFFTLPLEPSFHEWTRARAYLGWTKKGVPAYLPLPYREWTELEAYASFTDSRYRTIRKPSKRLKKKDWMICGMRNCNNCLTKVLPFLSLSTGIITPPSPDSIAAPSPIPRPDQVWKFKQPWSTIGKYQFSTVTRTSRESIDFRSHGGKEKERGSALVLVARTPQ